MPAIVEKSDLHPVSLRFRSSELEEAFRADNTERMVRYVRWPLILGGILFTSYGFIDAAVVPAHAAEAWLIRAGVGALIMLVVLRMLRPVSRTALSVLYSAVALASGAGLLVETWWWADVGRLTTHTGVIILLIYIHVLSRMPFALVTALGWIISGGYLLTLALHPQATMLDVWEHGAAIASANLTGMVASYVLERYARRVFGQQRTLEAGRRELEAQAATLRDTNDYLASAIGELKQAQERLIQQEKLASLGALTAGIAHEIKNPLNFVNNFAGLNGELVTELRSTLAGDGAHGEEAMTLLDQIATNAERIQVHGRRADGIVRSMLAHSRQSPGVRTPSDVNAVVDEYLSHAYHGYRARGGRAELVVVRDFSEDVGQARIDPQEIGRVVINLASNAFDSVASRAQGEGPEYEPTVTVKTFREGNEVCLRVSDNGQGLSPEVRQRLFEPFFTTKPAGEGTGLGLSLANEIVVRGHGGTLEIEDTSSRGASFVVRLPA